MDSPTHVRTSALSFALVLSFAGALGSPAAAQDPALVVEVDAGAAMPTGALAAETLPVANAERAASFGLRFVLSGSSWRRYYLGFDQHRFSCVAAGCTDGDPIVATGFGLGLRVVPLRGREVQPWLQAGVMTATVETGSLPGEGGGVSDLGVGTSLGVGVTVPALRPISVTPSAVYSRVDATLPSGEPLALRFVALRLAVTLSF